MNQLNSQSFPELLIISRNGQDHPMWQSMAGQLLEQGIYFEFHDKPDLPTDRRPYKAILFDDLGQDPPLEEYFSQGGVALCLKHLPDKVSRDADTYYEDYVFYNLFNYQQSEFIIEHADLTRRHPVMERLQLDRSDETILSEMRDVLLQYLTKKIGWDETVLHAGKAAISVIDTYDDEELRQTLIMKLNELGKSMVSSIPYSDNKLAGLYMTIWLKNQTGAEEPMKKAREMLDQVIARRVRTMGVLNISGMVDDPLGKGCLDEPCGKLKKKIFPSWSAYQTAALHKVNWTDSLHLHGPALAAMSRETNDLRYLNEALALIRHVGKYHVDTDGLVFHGTRDGKGFTAKWGRGHTHALLGMLYVLEEMPSKHLDRSMILGLIEKIGRGLKKHQDPATGLFHNVIDNPQSRLESSCTANIVYVYSRCINAGWLSAEVFGQMCLSGWEGIKRVYWKGGLGASCVGTQPAGPTFYLGRPQGWGMTCHGLMAGIEVKHMRESLKNGE